VSRLGSYMPAKSRSLRRTCDAGRTLLAQYTGAAERSVFCASSHKTTERPAWHRKTRGANCRVDLAITGEFILSTGVSTLHHLLAMLEQHHVVRLCAAIRWRGKTRAWQDEGMQRRVGLAKVSLRSHRTSRSRRAPLLGA